MNNINAILYEELRGYLKEENERIENDLFKAVLSACRLVNAGQGLTSSCSLAGISSVATHYEGIVLRPYVKAVMKKAEPRIEKTLKNIEEYRNRKERFENIEVDLKENSKQSDDEFMEEYNLLIHLEAFYSYSKKDKTKFQIPYNRLRLSKKYFNSEKNKWSFKCGNCSELINIDVQETYYTIFPEYMFNTVIERGCSKGCTKVIAKDIIQNWLHTNELATYFYVEDLDKEITDLIYKA